MRDSGWAKVQSRMYIYEAIDKKLVHVYIPRDPL